MGNPNSMTTQVKTPPLLSKPNPDGMEEQENPNAPFTNREVLTYIVKIVLGFPCVVASNLLVGSAIPTHKLQTWFGFWVYLPSFVFYKLMNLAIFWMHTRVLRKRTRKPPVDSVEERRFFLLLNVFDGIGILLAGMDGVQRNVPLHVNIIAWRCFLSPLNVSEFLRDALQ